ncbi:Uncharacterised protein [Bordetella pertussis]|nr:Uncharacterised protein [Bordetella pertussis]
MGPLRPRRSDGAIPTRLNSTALSRPGTVSLVPSRLRRSAVFSPSTQLPSMVPR